MADVQGPSGLCRPSRTDEWLKILSGPLIASFSEGMQQATCIRPQVISHNGPPRWAISEVFKGNSAA
jgi:hypothetical protein